MKRTRSVRTEWGAAAAVDFQQIPVAIDSAVVVPLVLEPPQPAHKRPAVGLCVPAAVAYIP